MPPSSRPFLRTNSPPFPLPSNSCLSYCLSHLLSVLIPSSSSLFPSLLIIPSVSPPFPSFSMPPPSLSSFFLLTSPSSHLPPISLYIYICLSHISSKSFPSSPSLLLLSFPFHPSLSCSISHFPSPHVLVYISIPPPAPLPSHSHPLWPPSYSPTIPLSPLQSHSLPPCHPLDSRKHLSKQHKTDHDSSKQKIV